MVDNDVTTKLNVHCSKMCVFLVYSVYTYIAVSSCLNKISWIVKTAILNRPV